MNNVEIVIDKKNTDYGGVVSLITGSPGFGKTNTMCNMAERDLEKSIVLWRGKNTCQWTIFLNNGNGIVFWLHKDVDYILIDRDTGQRTDFRSYGEVRYWDSPDNLIRDLEKRKINVVYAKHGVMKEREHLNFIDDWNSIFVAMLEREYIYPISVHFDEVEDLAPESKSGFYMKVMEFANNLKEFRKNWIHFNGAAHKETEIFWVVRNKIPWTIKMKGSKPNKHSRLYKRTLQKLQTGEAYIEDDGRFDYVEFCFIGKPRNFILKTNIKMENEENKF